jgi:hypothetical protein
MALAEKMRRVVEALLAEGVTGYTTLADRLNQAGYRTRGDGEFSLYAVKAVLARLGLRKCDRAVEAEDDEAPVTAGCSVDVEARAAA